MQTATAVRVKRQIVVAAMVTALMSLVLPARAQAAPPAPPSSLQKACAALASDGSAWTFTPSTNPALEGVCAPPVMP
jgi:hypothetical protein